MSKYIDDINMAKERLAMVKRDLINKGTSFHEIGMIQMWDFMAEKAEDIQIALDMITEAVQFNLLNQGLETAKKLHGAVLDKLLMRRKARHEHPRPKSRR